MYSSRKVMMMMPVLRSIIFFFFFRLFTDGPGILSEYKKEFGRGCVKKTPKSTEPQRSLKKLRAEGHGFLRRDGASPTCRVCM